MDVRPLRKDAPALVRASMMGDRADVILAEPEEISPVYFGTVADRMLYPLLMHSSVPSLWCLLLDEIANDLFECGA